VTVKAGQILRIVHPITLQSEEVTVTADKVGDTVFVTSTTLANSYPAGAYVYVSAESLQAGIIIGENAVRIYAEGQSLGRLATAIDGLVTSINAHLYTKLVQGMEFLVINEQTGRTYAFTVDQSTAGPGVVTFDVEAQVATARVGDYLVGDNSFQQSQITVTQGEIVLKVDSLGRVAQVRLSADNDSGSEIDISAEQVKINGIIFTEGSDPMYFPGDIATSDYMAGSAGWKIDGDGSAEFNNVVVRGEIEAQSGAIEGTLTMGLSGAITNTGNRYFITFDGLRISSYDDLIAPTTGSAVDIFRASTTNTIGQLYGRHDTIGGDEWVELTGEDYIIFKKVNGSDWARIDASALTIYATTDASSKDTGSIITEGGIGIEKNAYIGGALNAPKVGVTTITDAQSPYTVLATDSYIGVDNSANAVTVNLPAGTAGRKVTIYDYAGTASLGTITINRASTNTINGSTSTTLTTNYQSVTLLFTGGNWTII